jgi:tagatose-1,6-bisphosphate aldolase
MGNSEAGRVRGIVVKKLVSNIRLKGYVHHASTAEPQYVIKSVKTDHVAIHKGQALRHVRGSRAAYDRELRPTLTIDTIHALQDGGAEPDVWKIEGLDRREDCERTVQAARRGGRTTVSCIVLGRGSDELAVVRWLTIAAGVTGFIGFAVGRTTWLDTVTKWRARAISRESAVIQIAKRFRERAAIFEHLPVR